MITLECICLSNSSLTCQALWVDRFMNIFKFIVKSWYLSSTAIVCGGGWIKWFICISADAIDEELRINFYYANEKKVFLCGKFAAAPFLSHSQSRFSLSAPNTLIESYLNRRISWIFVSERFNRYTRQPFLFQFLVILMLQNDN